MLYLGNAFSLNMLAQENATVQVRKLTLEEAKALLADGFISAVGHADTANVISDLLGVEVPFNRITLKLQEGDQLVVAQYVGPRLPEGSVKLPEGARIDFYVVSLL